MLDMSIIRSLLVMVVTALNLERKLLRSTSVAQDKTEEVHVSILGNGSLTTAPEIIADRMGWERRSSYHQFDTSENSSRAKMGCSVVQ